MTGASFAPMGYLNYSVFGPYESRNDDNYFYLDLFWYGCCYSNKRGFP
jgi:hypothetical protein